MSPRWVEYLASNEVYAEHWSNTGAHNASDTEIMAYAISHDFVVFTHDLDFSAILAATQSQKPSVIQMRGDDLNPDSIGAVVVEALTRSRSELAAGALITIDAQRMRLRILPLSTS